MSPLSGWIITPITVVVICVFGIIANIISIIVLSRKEMQSSYIYNLRGLAYSDTLILIIGTIRTLDKIISLPDFLTDGNLYTKQVIFFAAWICNTGTKYFTVAVSLERFLAVTYPLKARNWMSLKKAQIIAWTIFAFSVGLSIFSYIYVNYIDQRSYSLYIVIILHFLPFFLVIVFNTFIFVGIRRFSRLGKEETKAASITRMLFMVVLLFGVCSSVEVARRIWIFFDKDIVEKPHYDHMINHFSDVFYVFNSAANFIIYYCWGTEFRKVFFQVFSFGGRDVIQSEVATSENIIAPSGSITEQGWI